MAANWLAYRRTTVLTAYSAVASWVRISARIWLISDLSLRIPRWKSKIPPISFPWLPVIVCRRAVTSAALVRRASSSRPTSRSVSDGSTTCRWGMTRSSASSTTAVLITTPGETPMPFLISIVGSRQSSVVSCWSTVVIH